jgi:hypothetical protein
MMKAIEYWSRDDGTEAFDLAMERGIFVQRAMGPGDSADEVGMIAGAYRRRSSCLLAASATI